jgi:hypothetical protein
VLIQKLAPGGRWLTLAPGAAAIAGGAWLIGVGLIR